MGEQVRDEAHGNNIFCIIGVVHANGPRTETLSPLCVGS